MMNRILCLALLLIPAVLFAQAPDTLAIPLNHLQLAWSAPTGLVVTCDGRTMFAGTTTAFTAHDKAWTWSYAGKENQSAKLETRGAQKVLTITCADPKLPWQQVVTAGPGDKFTLRYSFRQLAFDQPDMEYEVNAAVPTTGWFVGANWKATVADAPQSGSIPREFAGAANPFGGATAGEFSTLFGKLSFKSSVGLTLYDYQQRQHLWLGRDGAFPKGVEQKWTVEYAFAPAPFAVSGIELSQVQLREQPENGKFPASLLVRRLPDGPRQVKVTLALGLSDNRSDELVNVAEETLTLTDQPQRVRLAVPCLAPGQHRLTLRVTEGAKVLYASLPILGTVPQYLSLRAARVPLTNDGEGEVLVRVDPAAGANLTLRLTLGKTVVHDGPLELGKTIPLKVDLKGVAPGPVAVLAVLEGNKQPLQLLETSVLVAAPNPNGVVIDNRSRTLLVGGLPFCPQSCYADMQSVKDVIETEPVFGFNTIAPYLSTDLAERRKTRADLLKLFDRCAQVGLYVQLCVHGASRPPHTDEKWAWLKEEIEAFRNHPALLSYYLADEPELGWAKPEDCELAYRKIKEWDPWHPVTMVFCQSEAAARYAKGMDVCMTDPYPIPNGPVTAVADYCDRIERDLGSSLPLWVVPQAFGGGEGWRREPSRQEMRVMTYLSYIHNARGIQYFIRRPPSVNPNSPDLWSECRRLMLELSQLTPAMSSSEPQPQVKCDLPQVHVTAFQRDGALTVLTANVKNAPAPLTLTLPSAYTGPAEVLFENRTVEVAGGKLSDLIDAMSTRVYRVPVAPPPPDRVKLDPRNLIFNPSWEEAHNVGTPDGCYVGYGADKAASWYVDPRTAVHGRQSLRLTTPVEGQGMGISPFPLALTPGKKYALSIWAKGEREGQKFAFSLDAAKLADTVHALTTEWQEYRVEFTASPEAKERRSPYLTLQSAGRAWFDVLQVVPVD
ncbi:MAG: hypothetical protein WCP21_00705 [Armatimonadota bacterium]